MLLPSDISKLITLYLIEPNYVFAKWVKNIPNFFDRLKDCESEKYLSQNPRAIKRTTKPNTISLDILVKNTNPRAIKLISSHLDLLSWARNKQEWLDDLIEREDSCPVIDKLYKLDPKLFTRPEMRNFIAKSKSCENIILKTRHKIMYAMSYLLRNPSDKILDLCLINPTTPEIACYMCKNHNIRALNLGLNSGFISKWLVPDNRIDWSKVSSRDKEIINILVESLISNKNPEAIVPLRNLLTNLFDISKPAYYMNMHPDIRELIFGYGPTYANSSDLICDLIAAHMPREADDVCLFKYNTNEKVIGILQNSYAAAGPDNYIHWVIHVAEYPVFGNVIKWNPGWFGKCPNIYGNPCIYKPVTNEKLVNRIKNLIN